MRQRCLARSGVVVGLLIVTVASRADEATAVATIKKVGGWIKTDEHKPGNPVTRLLLTVVSEPGMYALIEMPKLESLLLNRTRVTDASLKLLPYFKSLQHVQVWETRGVGDAGVRNLRTALPQLSVGRELTRQLAG